MWRWGLLNNRFFLHFLLSIVAITDRLRFFFRLSCFLKLTSFLKSFMYHLILLTVWLGVVKDCWEFGLVRITIDMRYDLLNVYVLKLDYFDVTFLLRSFSFCFLRPLVRMIMTVSSQGLLHNHDFIVDDFVGVCHAQMLVVFFFFLLSILLSVSLLRDFLLSGTVDS